MILFTLYGHIMRELTPNRAMKNLYGLLLILPFQSFGAGPAGEIVSLQCSQAISSAIEYIENEKLEIDLNLKDGVFLCIGPTNGNKYVMRIQNSAMSAGTKKHYFDIDAENYAVIKYAYSR